MKVTKNQLKQLISEEIKNAVSEDRSMMPGGERNPMDDYFRRELEKRKAAQQKTPAPADSTDKADMSVEERLASIEKKIDQLLANNNLSEA